MSNFAGIGWTGGPDLRLAGQYGQRERIADSSQHHGGLRGPGRAARFQHGEVERPKSLAAGTARPGAGECAGGGLCAPVGAAGKASLLITHAGLNSVLEGICRAVPMVALPRRGDTPGVGARIERSGVGLRTSDRASAETMRQLIDRVLTEDSFRQRAKAIQVAMLAAGGVSRAADITEEALTTGRPVRGR